MAGIGRINCYGKLYAPEGWPLGEYRGVNRLYYIHGGTGGYEINGQRTYFHSGWMYFIPCSVDFLLFTDKTDTILHTFADFELFHPFNSPDVLSLACGNALFEAAKSLFLCGAEYLGENHMSISEFQHQTNLFQMCTGAMLYLSEYIAAQNQLYAVTDPVIVSVMEYMSQNLDGQISIKELAKEHFLTTDGLIRRFRHAVGTTPYAYLKNLRISTAFTLLRDGKSLKETAALVGYSDSAALLHAMKPTSMKPSSLNL